MHDSLFILLAMPVKQEALPSDRGNPVPFNGTGRYQQAMGVLLVSIVAFAGFSSVIVLIRWNTRL